MLRSEALWGSVQLQPQQAQRGGAALGAWLARRSGALRQLQLDAIAAVGSGVDLEALLAGLAGSPLVSLSLSPHKPGGQGGDVDGALAQLQHLTSLTALELGWTRLRQLPPALSALSSLCYLDLTGNQLLGRAGEEEGWAPLRRLRGLTRLRIR